MESENGFVSVLDEKELGDGKMNTSYSRRHTGSTRKAK